MEDLLFLHFHCLRVGNATYYGATIFYIKKKTLIIDGYLFRAKDSQGSHSGIKDVLFLV